MENNDSLIKEIEIAFAGVKLEDGVSWRETRVIDFYGTDEERKIAREQDEHNDWQKIPLSLISDSHHSLALPFLDPKGLRYYLPACMIFILKEYENSDSFIIESFGFRLADVDTINELQDVLTEQQKIAVAKFLRSYLEFMYVNDEKKNCIEKYWFKYLNS